MKVPKVEKKRKASMHRMMACNNNNLHNPTYKIGDVGEAVLRIVLHAIVLSSTFLFLQILVLIPTYFNISFHYFFHCAQLIFVHARALLHSTPIHTSPTFIYETWNACAQRKWLPTNKEGFWLCLKVQGFSWSRITCSRE